MQFPIKVKPRTGDYAGQVILVTNEDELAQVGPFDLARITPEEMNAEIKTARVAALRKDNPILSRLFPSTMRADAEGRGNWSQLKANIKDGADMTGRAVVAFVDAIHNTPYGSNPGTVFAESFGTPYDEETDAVGERSFLGKLMVGAIKDPLLIPSLAVPVGRIPYIAKMTRPLLKSATGGLVSSSIAEGARPLLVDDGFDAKSAAKNIALGTAIPVGLHGMKAGARGVERMVRGDYSKALARLSELNNVDAEALDLLSTPDGWAGLRANFRQEPDIAEREMLSLAGFSDERFPEYKQWGDFLQREAQSTPDVATDDLADVMLGYGSRKTAGGGGLTSDEKTIANSLKSDSDIFFDQAKKKPEPPPLILDQFGNPMAREPAKVTARKMNAYQLNDARKRVGSLLDDEWKKMAAGRPDDEIKVLKDVYSGLRAKTLEVAERKGETEALKAYGIMSQKLGARDKLWDLARIGSNKNRAQQNAEKAVVNAFNNKNADHRALQDAFKATDLAFGTNLYGRARYASHAKNLANSKLPDNKPFEPASGSKWFTGRGKQEVLDDLRGRTVKSAGEKLARMKELQRATNSVRPHLGKIGMGVQAPELEYLRNLAALNEENQAQDQFGFMTGR